MEAWDVEIYYNNIKTSNWKSHVLILKGSMVSHTMGEFSAAASYSALASQVPTAPLLPSHIFPSHLNVSFPPLSDFSKRNPLQPLPPTSATGLLLHRSNSVTLKWLPITIVCQSLKEKQNKTKQRCSHTSGILPCLVLEWCPGWELLVNPSVV